jgi:hypothetical protein
VVTGEPRARCFGPFGLCVVRGPERQLELQ